MQIPCDAHAAPVLGLYVTPRAQAYYRLAVPLGIFGGSAVTSYAARTPAQVDTATTVVLSRVAPLNDAPTDAGRALVQQIQDGGRRRVVIDLDDDLTPPAGMEATEWTPATRAHLIAMIAAADTVVVTNTELAARLRGHNRDVRVVPNLIDPAAWPAPVTPPDGPTWLLLTGSSSHDRDWRQVEAPLRRVKARYGAAVRLRVVGHLPAYLRALCDDHRPPNWGDLALYQARISGCHVALCPLPRSEFNACKSPVKLYETALSGCAVLGSACQYGPVLRAAGLPHAVATPQTWERKISRYLDDPAARAQDAAALRAYVTKHLDARRHAATIQAAYAA